MKITQVLSKNIYSNRKNSSNNQNHNLNFNQNNNIISSSLNHLAILGASKVSFRANFDADARIAEIKKYHEDTSGLQFNEECAQTLKQYVSSETIQNMNDRMLDTILLVFDNTDVSEKIKRIKQIDTYIGAQGAKIISQWQGKPIDADSDVVAYLYDTAADPIEALRDWLNYPKVETKGQEFQCNSLLNYVRQIASNESANFNKGSLSERLSHITDDELRKKLPKLEGAMFDEMSKALSPETLKKMHDSTIINIVCSEDDSNKEKRIGQIELLLNDDAMLSAVSAHYSEQKKGFDPLVQWVNNDITSEGKALLKNLGVSRNAIVSIYGNLDFRNSQMSPVDRALCNRNLSNSSCSQAVSQLPEEIIASLPDYILIPMSSIEPSLYNLENSAQRISLIPKLFKPEELEQLFTDKQETSVKQIGQLFDWLEEGKKEKLKALAKKANVNLDFKGDTPMRTNS